MILDPVPNIIVMMLTVILDVHHGYWLGSASRVSNISEEILLTVLRVAQGLATFLFSHSLIISIIGVGNTNEMISALLSLIASASMALIMFRRDRMHGRIQAMELKEVKSMLLKEFDEKVLILTKGMEKVLEKFMNELDEETVLTFKRVDGLKEERNTILHVTRSCCERLNSLAEALQAVVSRLLEREEMLDFKMQANAPRNVSEEDKEEEEQTSSTELTREDGRANRMKGINAQKELADMLRSWGLHVTVNYSRGMPDIIAKSSDKAAVFASKAYTLSENGTKQRSVRMIYCLK